MKLKKENKLIALAAILCVSIIACSEADLQDNKSEQVALEQKTMSGTEAPLLSANGSYEAEETEHTLSDEKVIPIILPDKLIKTAKINFEVDDYIKARKQLDSVKNKCGAYVMKEDEQHKYNRIETTVVLRVQNSYFEKLIAGIGGVAKKIDNKTIDTYDVTEEFIDLEARIKTKKAVEKRYLEILHSAHKIKDILAVENDIRAIREEIEAKEGRLRYLSNKVSFSTITITMYQEIIHEKEEYIAPGFFKKLWKSISNGWEGLLLIILGFTNIWPLLITGALTFYFVRRRIQKKKS